MALNLLSTIPKVVQFAEPIVAAIADLSPQLSDDSVKIHDDVPNQKLYEQRKTVLDLLEDLYDDFGEVTVLVSSSMEKSEAMVAKLQGKGYQLIAFDKTCVIVHL